MTEPPEDENDLTDDEVREMWQSGQPVDVYSYYDDDDRGRDENG